MAELTIKILSVIIGAVLATFGWIRNDLIFMIPAMIIAPMGSLLNDISFSIINLQGTNILSSLLMFGVASIISIIISFRLGKIVKVDTEKLKKTDQFNETKWIHLTIAVIIGIFTAVCLSTPSTFNKILCIIVGMAATILTPLIDIGVVSSLPKDQSSEESVISNDLKICLTNILGFTLGASAVHYYFKKNK